MNSYGLKLVGYFFFIFEKAFPGKKGKDSGVGKKVVLDLQSISKEIFFSPAGS